MAPEHALLTWAHLVAASVWVGGSLFFGVVLAPVLKRAGLEAEQRIALMVRIGRRFNWAAVPALGVLIATGIYAAPALVTRPDALLASSYGSWLLAKSALVVLVLALFAAHVWVIRRSVEERVMSGTMRSSELASLRKKIIVLGEAIVVASVAVLFAAAVLDSGA